MLHIILIALTVLEVFIYSGFFNAGQDKLVYEQHAAKVAPYIAIIVGFILTFGIAVRLIKKNPAEKRLIGLGLPIGYILIDILILLLSGTDLLSNFWVFSISYLTKLFAGFLSLKTTK